MKALILGAGASADANQPLVSNFKKVAHQVVGREESPPPGLAENSAFTEMPEDCIRLVRSALKNWNTEHTYQDIEQVFVLVDLLARMDFEEVSPEVYTNPKVYYHLYTYLIARVFASCTRDEDTLVYDRFVSNLMEINERVKIITTNWDPALDFSAFRSEQARPFYEYDRIHFSPEDPYPDGDDELLEILKLHGSANWWFCERCKTLEIFTDMREIIETLDRHYQSNRYVEDQGRECAFGDECGHDVYPALIPPTGQKFGGLHVSHPFARIWRDALHTLLQAETVHLIGYSLPSTDVQIRMFLRDALQLNSNLEEVVVVSPGKSGRKKSKHESKFQDLVAKTRHSGKIRFNYQRFEEWVDQDMSGALS